MWAAWKTTLHAHQLTLEREQRATGEWGDIFGSAATAITIHGITADTSTPGTLLTPDTLAFLQASAAAITPSGDFALQALKCHLNNMYNTATNSGLNLFRITYTTTREY